MPNMNIVTRTDQIVKSRLTFETVSPEGQTQYNGSLIILTDGTKWCKYYNPNDISRGDNCVKIEIRGTIKHHAQVKMI